MQTFLFYLGLLQAPLLPDVISLTQDCSGSPRVIAQFSEDTPFRVRFSLAGQLRPCYAVTVVVEGEFIQGYLQRDDLNPVQEFKLQQRTAATSLPIEIGVAAAENANTDPPEPTHYPPFANFWAPDMMGKLISPRSLKGKVNLVYFWSPSNPQSVRELLAVTRLYGQFQNHGLDVLAVSLSGRIATKEALDEFLPGFHNVPTGSVIAAKYHIDYEHLPRIYVLNSKFEVIASGLHDNALQELVSELIAAK